MSVRASKVRVTSLSEGRELRQIKYLNNMVEQDHRFIKRRALLCLSSFWGIL